MKVVNYSTNDTTSALDISAEIKLMFPEAIDPIISNYIHIALTEIARETGCFRHEGVVHTLPHIRNYIIPLNPCYNLLAVTGVYKKTACGHIEHQFSPNEYYIDDNMIIFAYAVTGDMVVRTRNTIKSSSDCQVPTWFLEQYRDVLLLGVQSYLRAIYPEDHGSVMISLQVEKQYRDKLAEMASVSLLAKNYGIRQYKTGVAL